MQMYRSQQMVPYSTQTHMSCSFSHSELNSWSFPSKSVQPESIIYLKYYYLVIQDNKYTQTQKYFLICSHEKTCTCSAYICAFIYTGLLLLNQCPDEMCQKQVFQSLVNVMLKEIKRHINLQTTGIVIDGSLNPMGI